MCLSAPTSGQGGSRVGWSGGPEDGILIVLCVPQDISDVLHVGRRGELLHSVQPVDRTGVSYLVNIRIHVPERRKFKFSLHKVLLVQPAPLHVEVIACSIQMSSLHSAVRREFYVGQVTCAEVPDVNAES